MTHTPSFHFPLNTVGRIVAGDETGCYVQVVPDDGNYVIYISRTPDLANSFDGWMYDMQDVVAYFVASRWVVQWADQAA